MYFWKTAQLADDIKNNKVSEKSKMYYYLLMMLMFNVFAYSFLLDLGAEDVSVDIFEMIITTVILVGGILINFKANKGVDGVDYMARVIMLGVPIAIKLTIVMMLFGFILASLKQGLELNFSKDFADQDCQCIQQELDLSELT